jgi:hypothetical protein
LTEVFCEKHKELWVENGRGLEYTQMAEIRGGGQIFSLQVTRSVLQHTTTLGSNRITTWVDGESERHFTTVM